MRRAVAAASPVCEDGSDKLQEGRDSCARITLAPVG